MAVDAKQFRVSPSLMIQPKREFINTTYQETGNMHNTNMDSSVANGQELIPSLQLYPVHDPVSATTMMNSISDITCSNFLASGQRLKDFNSFKGNKFSNMPDCFLDEDAIHLIQRHQSEIDQIIAQHAEGIRLELDGRRKEQSRMLVSYINHVVMKKLKEKDEEIEKMRKLNWVLEERAKNLSMENQLWRDLAQTNEATANSLRSNLEQALAQVGQEHNKNNGGEAIAEDVESCCGSTDYSRTRCMVGNRSSVGMCRRCGVEESRVLLLPCRHLCLCALCSSSVYTCPICNSIMDGSVHVNTLHQILPQ